MADDLLTRAVSRREFNAASATALFVGMTVWLSGCGKSSDGGGSVTSPTPTPAPSAPAAVPPTQASDKVGTVADNHGHSATVTAAQLQASGAVLLYIKGTADHDHSVQLAAAQVAQVAAGSRVTASSTSSLGGSDGYGGYTAASHSHTVTFN